MKYFNDEVDFSSGLGKFIHALTWPIRKFYIVVPVLTLLIALPIFFGAKPTQIHTWYKDETIKLAEKTPEFVSTTYGKIKRVLGFTNETDTFRAKRNANVAKSEPGVETLVDMPKRRTIATKRKGFGVANEISRIEIEVDSSNIDVNDTFINDNDYVVENVSVIVDNAPFDVSGLAVPLKEQKLPLTYLKSPKMVRGSAVVKNPNEIEVGNVYIVLYGIYSDPKTMAGMQAKAYLETKARKNEIKCGIVAYTYQNVATAICFAGKENINKTLVEKGYSKNVALPGR